MATLNDVYREAHGRMTVRYKVEYSDRIGKRRSITLKSPEAAAYFLEEIIKKEDMWRAQRAIAAVKGR